VLLASLLLGRLGQAELTVLPLVVLTAIATAPVMVGLCGLGRAVELQVIATHLTQRRPSLIVDTARLARLVRPSPRAQATQTLQLSDWRSS
jgi:hypothetical protein